MNGRVLVSALLGGILIFVWQSLSWAALDLHGDAMASSAEGQVEILESMSNHLEDKLYYLSYADPEADYQSFNEQAAGKPVAVTRFIPSYENKMGPLMLRGLVYAILVAFVVSLILSRSRANTFLGRWLTVMGFALVLILLDTLGDMNWWFDPMSWVVPEIVDYLAMFALSGAFMAWWMGRGQETA